MIGVEQITNSRLNSNTYILWDEQDCDKNCWIIDPGDIEPLSDFVNTYYLKIKGMLITHYHFDHIYGANDVRERFGGGIPIICGKITRNGLLDARMNMSLYNETPFVVGDNNIFIVASGDKVELWNGVSAIAYYTPGHNDDCFSFAVENKLFTGDALIPNIKVHTKSKRADKIIAEQTVECIIRKFDRETTIYPGHNKPCKIKELL